MSEPETIAAAYSHCEAVTRTQAANFFYGIRLLPGDRRRAISAVYAFARRVDDIGDGTLPHEQKLLRLDEQQRAVATGGIGSDDPVIVALADAHRRFRLPGDALCELIEGVRMDVLGVSYATFEDLLVYCRRVAGGIGRLCLAIFGQREQAGADRERAERLADELGVALQLTNILRDMREDAQNGRVYLPAEDLDRYGLSGEPGGAAPAPAELLDAFDRVVAGGAGASEPPVGTGNDDHEELARLSALVRFESERAREWFDRGIALTELLDRRSAACVLAMAGIYRRLLSRIEDRPEEALRQRMSIPAREKAWVVACGMLGVGA